MTARALTVPIADHERVTAQRDHAMAVTESVVRALADVMRTLGCQAGSPSERAAWAKARALLAEHGSIAAAESAQYQAAFEEWERCRR